MVQGARGACIVGILDKLRDLCPLQGGWSFVWPIEAARLGGEHRGTVMDGVSNVYFLGISLKCHDVNILGSWWALC